MRPVLLLGLSSLLGACATVDPPGWAAREALPSLVVNAKPGVMYGVAPTRWVSPVGEIAISHDAAVTLAGPLTPGTRFDVRFADSDEPGLACEVRGDGAPLFGCASPARGVALTVGHGCAFPDNVTQPACYEGQLQLGDEQLRLGQGYLKRTRAPVGYLAVTAPDGTLRGAANVVPEAGMRLWLPPAPEGDQRQRSLVLLFAALHQLAHFTR